MTAVTDKLWGTRTYTEGANLQKPRKVPLRVEPKSFFALERTFLSWMGMAVTLGGVSSALVGFSAGSPTEQGQLISSTTIDIVIMICAPLSIVIMLYALFTYEWRVWFLRKKQMGFFDDRVGPSTVAALVLITLLIIFSIAFVDFIY
ncbi:hypothetical protein CEUSTIGMA_g13538.t1 [Chlamydomonas eustigma]|uniref:DUF202 domain-containing protein n=1 Tax=Chlamydomonas eustigma TaxID=1157962 RepID=A0A250XSU3_9CHLO|nr:hypothetical protein CEUSTIGMA_g13538.t1 [Chlamydomonas eustigma]|eukprot:GAX86125.1 hypothetical protein CEUSTIGMA_g13538.t1 [Chlamydomonas eustigma]